MEDMQTSPLTDEDSAQTPDEVFEIVYFRATQSDEDWGADPASSKFDLSREEAARRLDEQDYSPLG